jgi:hypothetical protein
MWGYSLLIRLLGSVGMVVALQSILGALAIALLMVRLNWLAPGVKVVTTTFFVLAMPWLSFMAYAYQMPISSAFMILALLAVEMAIQPGGITWGIVAGVLMGLGQNFRSELVLLPGTILVVVVILRQMQWLRCPSIKPLVVCVGVALMLQMPWALNCYFNAGRFSLTESNLGHVAFTALGRPVSNPWNIVKSDAFAQETVTKAGLECSSLSFQGGDFLKHQFITSVQHNPSAYVKCILLRIANTTFRGFCSINFAVTPAEAQWAGQQLTTRLEPFLFHRTAVSPEPTEPVSKIRVGCAILYVLSQRALSCAVSILGIMGFFLAMRKGPFQLKQPLVLLLGIAMFYRFGLNVAISEGQQYMIGVYLCYLPFAVNTVWVVSKRCLRPRLVGDITLESNSTV